MIDINNPGNIRPLKNDTYKGQIGIVNDFVQFDTMAHGIRAWLMNFHAAVVTHGRTNLTQYITAYAPPKENDTAGYIEKMCNITTMKPEQAFDLSFAQTEEIMRAQFIIENGMVIASKITDSDWLNGFELFTTDVPNFIK